MKQKQYKYYQFLSLIFFFKNRILSIILMYENFKWFKQLLEGLLFIAK